MVPQSVFGSDLDMTFGGISEIITPNAQAIYYAQDTTGIVGPFWSTASQLNTPRYNLAGCGTTSNSLSFGGSTGSYLSTTEKWNGTAWATTTAMTQAR